jgi:hypothetical protein
VQYQIWGAMEDDKSDAQLITTCFTQVAAEIKTNQLNNEPNNHPDLYYFWDNEGDQP